MFMQGDSPDRRIEAGSQDRRQSEVPPPRHALTRPGAADRSWPLACNRRRSVILSYVATSSSSMLWRADHPVSYLTSNVRVESHVVMGVDKPGGHVFISYVHEDWRHVERLQRLLESAGVQVWRDTADLWPGEDWRGKIRQAITGNVLVFIACFLEELFSVKRPTSEQSFCWRLNNSSCAAWVSRGLSRSASMTALFPITISVAAVR